MTDVSRIMGVDHGEVRIGVALTDPLRLFAQPYAIVPHTDKETALGELRRIVETENVGKIVVGLPTDAESRVGHQARIVLGWARNFAGKVDVPVIMWDESHSSLDGGAMAASGGRRRRSGDPVDDLAAAAILQDYLDAGGGEHEPGQPLDAFSPEA
jgi:putative Holliday junction resolvase